MVRRIWVLGVWIAVIWGCAPFSAGSPTITPAPADRTETPVPEQASAAPAATDIRPTQTQVPSPIASPTRPPAASSTATALPGESGSRYAVVGVAQDDVLNIRADAGVANPIIGTIPPYGTDIRQLPGEKQVDGSTWVAIRYGEVQGWVNRGFLAEQFGQADPVLASRSAVAIQAIQEGDFHRLSQLVHPRRGLRFSAYGYIRMEDLVFNASQISGLFTDPRVYLWGYYDGSGNLIELTFTDYYRRFVYDVEFARPEAIGFDQLLGRGNTINNISQYYPQARFVEYHFSGFDPQYGGLDWRSLRLVFELFDGTWYLVGVVHDEWTT